MDQIKYSTEARTGKHLCLWERKEIEAAIRRGAGIRSIARILNRNPSTVSREIRRGTVIQRVKKYREPVKKEHRENWLPYKESRIYFADTGQAAALNNISRRGGNTNCLRTWS